MISVVLAVFNEEKNIKKCLDPVKDWADEIIVVDGSSEDNTRQIATQLGAKVIKTTNKPNFHINKQMAIDAAQGELILQLDADEVVDDELANFIQNLHQRLLAKSQIKSCAWMIKRKNMFMGRWLSKGGQYPDAVIRLFIKGKAWLPQKDVHEQMKVDGEIGTAKGHLIHYAYPSFKDYLRKFSTYTSFKAEQLADLEIKSNLITILNYLWLKPGWTFLMIYFRHKGFVDGVPGFIFALFSGLHHHVAFLKYWFKLKKKQQNKN